MCIRDSLVVGQVDGQPVKAQHAGGILLGALVDAAQHRLDARYDLTRGKGL